MDPTPKEPAASEGRCYTRHYSFSQLCTPPLSKAINNPCYKPIPVTSKRLKQGLYRQGRGPEKSM